MARETAIIVVENEVLPHVIPSDLHDALAAEATAGTDAGGTSWASLISTGDIGDYCARRNPSPAPSQGEGVGMAGMRGTGPLAWSRIHSALTVAQGVEDRCIEPAGRDEERRHEPAIEDQDGADSQDPIPAG